MLLNTSFFILLEILIDNSSRFFLVILLFVDVLLSHVLTDIFDVFDEFDEFDELDEFDDIDELYNFFFA